MARALVAVGLALAASAPVAAEDNNVSSDCDMAHMCSSPSDQVMWDSQKWSTCKGRDGSSMIVDTRSKEELELCVGPLEMNESYSCMQVAAHPVARDKVCGTLAAWRPKCCREPAPPPPRQCDVSDMCGNHPMTQGKMWNICVLADGKMMPIQDKEVASCMDRGGHLEGASNFSCDDLMYAEKKDHCDIIESFRPLCCPKACDLSQMCPGPLKPGKVWRSCTIGDSDMPVNTSNPDDLAMCGASPSWTGDLFSCEEAVLYQASQQASKSPQEMCGAFSFLQARCCQMDKGDCPMISYADIERLNRKTGTKARMGKCAKAE